MDEFKEKFADVQDKVNIVTVCCEPESDKKFKEFTARHNMTDLNLILDRKHSDAAYGIIVYPTYVLIDPEGNIVDFNTDRPSAIIRKSGTTDPSIFERTLRKRPR